MQRPGSNPGSPTKQKNRKLFSKFTKEIDF